MLQMEEGRPMGIVTVAHCCITLCSMAEAMCMTLGVVEVNLYAPLRRCYAARGPLFDAAIREESKSCEGRCRAVRLYDDEFHYKTSDCPKTSLASE